jgi:hypothetical protein
MYDRVKLWVVKQNLREGVEGKVHSSRVVKAWLEDKTSIHGRFTRAGVFQVHAVLFLQANTQGS